MTYNVLILDSSELIRIGMCKAISLGLSVGHCHQHEEASNLCSWLERNKIDIMVCNTIFYNDLRCIVAKLPSERPLMVGVVSNMFDEKIGSFFDELIYLNDPLDKIAKKLQMLVEKEHVPAAKLSTDLSDREREVLHLIAKGYSHKEISDELFISTHTVVTHRKNISQKLGIKSASGLTVYAILNNLIAPEEMQNMLQ